MNKKSIEAVKKNWENEILSAVESELSVYIALFSLDGELLYSNKAMSSLFTDSPKNSFLNPAFDEIVKGVLYKPDTFNGFITIGNKYSANNTSIKAEIKRKNNEILIIGGLDVRELINQNQLLIELNHEINNLQRELLKEKRVLKSTLDQLQISQTNLMISEKQVLEQNEALLKLNAAKDKFFSIIAHDLKSPLSGFIGLTKMIYEDYKDIPNETIRELSKSLYDSARSIFQLLENLLKWSLIQRDAIEFKPESIELSQIIEDTIKLLSEQARQKEIDIINRTHTEVKVRVDIPMMNTVFRNLISNAIKFTKNKGTIYLHTETKSDMIEIAIQDTGIGMSKELLQKLFKLDQRISRLGTNGETSTGLGLILCKEFVEKNGGEIKVTSEEEKGTTFSFTIPLSID